MKIISQPAQLEAGGRPVCAAIGFFDGVHQGHQAVIRHAVQAARQCQGLSVAITFDCHPQSIVAPERAPLLLQPLDSKLENIAALGVDAILLFRFNREFSRQSPEQFIGLIKTGFGRLASVSAGENFSFGYQRTGNIEALARFGRQFGFKVQPAIPILWGGAPVSSSRIRQSLQSGALDDVSAMLGRRYSIKGKVVAGDKLGHKLGYPTANLDLPGLLLPPNGVYAARAIIPGAARPAVLNIGIRPTLNQSVPQRRFEVHLLDWSGDLYGADLDAIFLRCLREERKFASLEELRGQIKRDIEGARQFLAS